MTQYDKIKQHLEAGNAITQLDAFTRFGCLRLAAVIHLLKFDYNMPIDSETVRTANGSFVSRYFLTVN